VALTPALPRSLYGDSAALAVTNLADFKVRLPGAEGAARAAAGGFESLYEQTSETLLRDSGAEAFDAIRLLSDAHLASYRPAAGAHYPESPLGRALRQIAQLVKADVGLEVAFAESAGWDTHVQQGTVTGSFARRARDLGDAIAAFWTDLGAQQSDVVLMTMTEFGRTVRENGSGGTTTATAPASSCSATGRRRQGPRPPRQPRRGRALRRPRSPSDHRLPRRLLRSRRRNLGSPRANNFSQAGQATASGCCERQASPPSRGDSGRHHAYPEHSRGVEPHRRPVANDQCRDRDPPQNPPSAACSPRGRVFPDRVATLAPSPP
jgi:hypothetical protein